MQAVEIATPPDLDSPPVEYALAYASLGLRVLPLYGVNARGGCVCGKPCDSPGKHPRIAAWPKAATTDAGQIQKWWTTLSGANVGIATGNGLLVLDVDGDEGFASLAAHPTLPETWQVKTGRGTHFYFRVADAIRNGVRMLPGVDVRGDGGYVVAPPSVHSTGTEYTWTRAPWDTALADAPAWLLDLLTQSPPTAKPQLSAPTLHEGERNEALYRLGRSLHAKGLGAPAILAALQAENGEKCDPPLSADEVEKIARNAAEQLDRPDFTPPVVQPEEPETPERGTSERVSLLTDDERTALRAHEASVTSDFILRWTEWASARTDAPTIFHPVCAAMLVATAIDRTLTIRYQHGDIFSSVYILVLAPSKVRKSQALGYAKRVSMLAFPDKVLPAESSAEALLQELSEKAEKGGTSSGVAFVDEAGRLLRVMRSQAYAEGLKDLLALLFNCPEDERRRLVKGEFTIRNAYVNLVMVTTPSRFSNLVSTEDIASGFLARFLPVVAPERDHRKPLTLRTEAVDKTEVEFVEWLKDCRKRHASPVARSVTVTPAALARLDQAEVDLERWADKEYRYDLVEPWRLSEYASRFAVIFAVSEGRDTVDVPQVLRALALIEQAKEGVLMVVESLTTGAVAEERERVARFIQRNPGITVKEICQRSHLPTERVQERVKELEGHGRISTKSEPKGRVRCYPVLTTETVA